SVDAPRSLERDRPRRLRGSAERQQGKPVHRRGRRRRKRQRRQRSDETAKQLHYRFKPTDPSNLEAGGQLQALQVLVSGSPLRFPAPAHSSPADVAAAANTDISGSNSSGFVSLHALGGGGSRGR